MRKIFPAVLSFCFLKRFLCGVGLLRIEMAREREPSADAVKLRVGMKTSFLTEKYLTDRLMLWHSLPCLLE